MGEEKKDKASKADGGDKKKDVAPPAEQAIVLKVDLHCAGCASKVKRAIKHAPGVESVKTDAAANKVVVTGAADAAELKERIEARAKKPVQIVSAGAGQPKKDKEKEKKGGGTVDKTPEKEKGKAEKEKSKPEKEKKAEAADKPKSKSAKEEKKSKEPKEEETVTLKIRLHCEGCIDRIKRRVYKIKGVKDVVVDAAKDLVKVTGTMDAGALPGYLRDKLSRPVEVVTPGNKDGGDKNKDKGAGAGDGGEKKKDGGGGGGGGADKMDKSAAAAAASVAPMPMADASMYQMPPQYGYHMPYQAPPGGYYGAAAPPPNPAAFYPNAGPAYYPPPYASHPAHAPQMFSDENPNACSVM